jgi:signal peptidase I
VSSFDASQVLALWDELRSRPGPFYVRMVGSSMWPAAPTGSLLAVSPCSLRDLAIGDLVTFRRGKSLVTHRVHALEGRRVITWGDTSLVSDGAIFEDAILGRAVVVERARPAWSVRLLVRRAAVRLLRS